MHTSKHNADSPISFPEHTSKSVLVLDSLRLNHTVIITSCKRLAVSDADTFLHMCAAVARS